MGFIPRFPGYENRSLASDSSILSMVAGHDPWDLAFPLFQWSPDDAFTLKNAVESVAIFGELGAAKTTGSAAWLILKYLEIGMGGLVCCVKPGDRELIEQYCRMTKRESSLIVVSPSNHWRFNIMHYALKKPGIAGSRVERIVSTLMTIVEAAERGERGNSGNGDKFWQRSLRQLLRNGVEVCIAARGDISMQRLHAVITSAPRSHSDVQSKEWQEGSECYLEIEAADNRKRSDREQSDFELAAKYFLSEVPDMPSDTRGSVWATYGVMADVLLRGHMADLFDGETNFLPELTFEGAIVVLDLPLKIYGQAGLYVQSAFTYLWQMAAEQRDIKLNPRPIFWLADEAQEVVGNYTCDFLATARQVRVASVLISQNKPNYIAAMGGDAGRHRVDAMLASTGTKIFHSNGDSETNRWASETISEEVQTRMNFHGARDKSGRNTGGGSEQIGKKVMAAEFTMLKKGGTQNDFMTDAIVFQSGTSFAANGGEPWIRTAFKQKIPGVTCKKTPE